METSGNTHQKVIVSGSRHDGGGLVLKVKLTRGAGRFRCSEIGDAGG